MGSAGQRLHDAMESGGFDGDHHLALRGNGIGEVFITGRGAKRMNHGSFMRKILLNIVKLI